MHLDKLEALAGYREILETIIDTYAEFYPELVNEQPIIVQFAELEKDKFLKTVAEGRKELEKLIIATTGGVMDGAAAFNVFAT